VSNTGSPGAAIEGATPAPQSRKAKALTAVAAVVAMAIVGSIMYALAGTAGTTAEDIPIGVREEPEELSQDVSVVAQTGEKRIIQVRIRSVAEEGLAFTATVAGLPEGSTGAWYAILDDGSELPLVVEDRGGALYAVSLEEPVPAGREIKRVRLDPDASDEDVLFNVS
jgi:hypothetical protein